MSATVPIQKKGKKISSLRIVQKKGKKISSLRIVPD
jgi:hypothetical protein